eukprot:SM000032S12064  [mRNA]  locus=s32:317116:319701:+ [translate_table: standard]
MQRGLRFCPASASLWLEYLRLELTYARKLRQRRVVLGLVAESSPPEASAATDAGGGVTGKTSASDADAELTLKVAQAIYRSAIAAIPDKPAFRLHMATVLQESDDPDSLAPLADEVYEGIAQDFPTSADCWEWRARRWLRKQSADGRSSPPQGVWQRVLETWEAALAAVPTPIMYERFIGFLEEHVVLEEDRASEERGMAAAKAHSQESMATLKQLYERLAAKDMMTADLAARRKAFLLRCGLLKRADEAPMVTRAPLDASRLASEGGGAASLASQSATGIASELLLHALERDAVSNEVVEKLYKQCIQIEACAAAAGDIEAPKQWRTLFESALGIYGSKDSTLWLEYCRAELLAGNPSAANAIHWRAKKLLEEPSNFLRIKIKEESSV